MPRKFPVLIMGIYLLIASLNFFMIAGDIGRYSALALGFLMVTGVALKSRLNRGTWSYMLLAMFFLIIYLVIANIKNQYTSTPILSLFTIISCLLLIAGRVLHTSKNLGQSTIPYPLFLFFILSSFACALLFIRYQISLKIIGRDFNLDDTINSIGIAYSCGLQSVFLLIVGGWLNKSRGLTILNGIVIASLFFVVISTLARGPLIFLIATIVMLGSKAIKLNKVRIQAIFFRFVLLAIPLSIFLQRSEFLRNKTQRVFKRLGSLFDHASGSSVDNSSLARQELQQEFFSNFYTFIVSGQESYNHYPHNIFLEILMRWGMFGLPLLIIVTVSLYRGFIKRVSKTSAESPLSHLLRYLMLYSFLVSMTSLSIEMNRILILSVGYFGAIRLSKNERRVNSYL